jgi:hypothetical protein
MRRLVFVFLAILSISFLLDPIIAADKRSSVEVGKSVPLRYESLFNGRDFQGWTQAGNWEITDGTFFCSKLNDKFPGEANNLFYSANPLPPDCEIVFQWKQNKAVQKLDTSNPEIAISWNYKRFDDDCSFGTGFKYDFAGLSVELHTRNLKEHICSDRIPSSGMEVSGQPKNYAKPIGQWNESRIVCKDSILQFWLNDHIVYGLNLEAEKTIKEMANDPVPQAIEDWINFKKAGLTFTVHSPWDEDGLLAGVRIRKIEIRELKDEEKSANATFGRIKTGTLMDETGAGSSASSEKLWNWKTHPLFGKLAFSPDDFPAKNTHWIKPRRFSAVQHMANPSGTQDRDFIRSLLFEVSVIFNKDISKDIKESDIKAAFSAGYSDEESPIGILSFQFCSEEKANSFRSCLVQPLDGMKCDFWISGDYFVMLYAGEDSHSENYEFLRNKLQKVLGDL